MLTPERIAEIRARVDAATPGPWEVREGMVVADRTVSLGGFMRLSNSHFAAHARQDVPDLLAALAATTTRADEWHAEALRAIESEQGAQDQWAEAVARAESAERALLPLAEGYGWRSDWCGWCQQLLSEEKADCPMPAVRAVLAAAAGAVPAADIHAQMVRANNEMVAEIDGALEAAGVPVPDHEFVLLDYDDGTGRLYCGVFCSLKPEDHPPGAGQEGGES